MGNRATENRDIQIAHAIQEGRIIVWADGFGVWHAKVLTSFVAPMAVAKLAIRLMLQERAPRDTYIDPPKVVHTPEDDTDTMHAYKEADPNMVTIATRYRTRPNSNVGRYEARGWGMQRSVIDQSLADPHRAAAEALVEAFNAKTGAKYRVGDQIDSTEDGQRRKWQIVESRTTTKES